MPTTDFNTGSGVKAARKLLMTFVNVGTGASEEWELVGRGVEESAIELNPNSETVTDICGITETLSLIHIQMCIRDRRIPVRRTGTICMNEGQTMRINILGTDYTITFKDYQDDKLISSNDYSGYCNEITKDIVCLLYTSRCV